MKASSQQALTSASPKVMGINVSALRETSFGRDNPSLLQSSPLKAKKSITTLSGASRVNQPQRTINTYRNSVWDPPVSCQRRLLPSSNYQCYFPIEISDRDYFNRLIALLVRAVDSLDYELLRGRLGNQTLGDLSNAVEELLNIIITNTASDKAGTCTHKFVMLYQQSADARDCLDQNAKPFLVVRDRFAEHLSGWDCCLVDNIETVFESTKIVIEMTKEYSMMRDEPLNVKTITNNLLHEVRDLLGQYRIHKQFQQQRLKELGWERPHVDSNKLDSGPETIEAEREDFHSIMTKFHNQKEEAEKYFLTFTAGARIQLIIRLLVIVDDLNLISRDVSEDSDYLEAERLRSLLHAVDRSITVEDRRHADEAILLTQQMYVTMLELLHLVAQKKQEMEFKNADLAEQASIAADQLHQRMAAVTSKCSLLMSQDDIKEKIRREGTLFINADFLFSTEFREDAVNIASLLVMAGAQDILNCVEHWPSLTILNRQRQNVSSSIAFDSSPTKMYQSSPSSPFPTSLSLLQSSKLSSQDLLASNHARTQGDLVNSSPNRRTIVGSFSQTMVDALQSFEKLQAQLDNLLTPISIAHSELLCRLIGIRGNLLQLVEMNTHTGNQSEKLRLSEFVTIIDGTIDTDEQDYLEEEDGVIGRGKKRIDGVWQLTKQVHNAIQELRKFKLRSRAQSDYTAAQAFEDMEKNLEERVNNVELSIRQFSLLDSDNDTITLEIMDLNERIAREGTEFISSDFLFSYSSGPKGHSIGSLAIVAGAGAMLRFIKSQWPNLTALGNSHRMDSYVEEDFGSGSLFPPTSSMEKTAMLTSSSAGNFESSVRASMLSRRKSSRLSLAMFSATAGSTNNGGVLSNTVVDFRDPNMLRLIGFDPKTLRSAGFSDIDILTAGFTAEQLKQAGFGPEAIFAAAGLSSPAIQAAGFNLDMLMQVLGDFFTRTNGGHWRKHEIWKDLPNFVSHLVNTKQEKGSNSQKHAVIMQFLARLKGVTMNLQTEEIEKLIIPQNNLSSKDYYIVYVLARF
jgi:hypothetical protein